MITNPENIKIDYERTRLSRYGNTPQNACYSNEDLLKAYLAWADEKMGREPEWNAYCDVRDGVPRGTNKKIVARRKESGY